MRFSRNRWKRFVRKCAYKLMALSEGDVGIAAVPSVDFERDEQAAPRLNLIIPVISKARAFGGITTAVRFFNMVAEGYAELRIVVLLETLAGFESEHWPGWDVTGSGSTAARQIIFLDWSAARLSIRSDDVFIATFWTTACIAIEAQRYQHDVFGVARSLIYFIQDYETAFYPNSSESLMVESTYNSDYPTIAIFNTKLLADFFSSRGYRFSYSFHFEPKLNPVLQPYLRALPDTAKKKNILIYCRPGTPRNAFSMIVEGLRNWIACYPEHAEWTLISVGEDHRDVSLPQGRSLRAAGKLSLEAYAATLLESAIGLSLMVSPHPSYPPMEMASFGMGVLTNDYANKLPSELNSNFYSLANVTPRHLGEQLGKMCRMFTMDADIFTNKNESNFTFCMAGTEFPFLEELNALLHRTILNE